MNLAIQRIVFWFRVPRDFETILRSFIRQIRGKRSASSYPLISGDSFKFECDYRIEGLINDNFDQFESLRNLEGRLFVQAIPGSNALSVLIKACSSGIFFPKLALVIHNGDVVPSSEEMEILNRSFKSIYSVNWLGDYKIAKPLPIGLENSDKMRNGVPKDFLKEIKRGLPEFNARDIDLLVCFSISTNPKERTLAWDLASKVPGAVLVNRPLTPRVYRKLLLRSRYVLSPPGNGADCHRTWEALYLGAIPIVLESHWPFKFMDLPVIRVMNWFELLKKFPFPVPSSSSNWKDISVWLK